MGHGKFVTVINCMDGRTQLPVNKWLADKYKADYVDTITEPAPNKILANEIQPYSDSIKRRLEISVNKHGSKLAAIVAHFDCAGNPVEKEKQIEDLKKSVEKIRSWDLGIEIIPLWVDEKWKVKKQVIL